MNSSLASRLQGVSKELALPLPSREQINQLSDYLRLLIQWNKKMNLVAAAAESLLIERHMVDSYVATEFAFSHLKLKTALDVGSGAGLPGVIMAILHPETRFTLCEPREKRSIFIRETSKRLGLENVSSLKARIEEIQGSFELITARAWSDELFEQGARLKCGWVLHLTTEEKPKARVEAFELQSELSFQLKGHKTKHLYSLWRSCFT